MNLQELKTQIITNDLDPLYYFSGEDWKLISVYTHQIAKVSAKKIHYIDSIKDILDNIKNSSMLSSSCYVIYNDNEYLTDEKSWDKLKELINKDIVIFIYNNLDKRSKFYKRFKDDIIEFSHMSSDVLAKHIKQAIDLSNENCERLINACENDYGRICSEINKIKNFSMFGMDYDTCCSKLFEVSLIHVQPTSTIFDLVDAILMRDTIAISLYTQCKQQGESNLAILQSLFNKSRAVLQVKGFTGNGDICKITGLKPGVIWGCKKLVNYCDKRRLKHIMRMVQHIEEGIKRGDIPEEISVDYVLVELLA